MNINKVYILLLTCALAFSACDRDDESLPESAERLYISAVLQPFPEDVTSQTRTANHGFLTSFEDGDEIGVTGIDADGNVIDVCNNVKFVYHDSETVNDVIWASFLNDRGYGFVEKVSERQLAVMRACIAKLQKATGALYGDYLQDARFQGVDFYDADHLSKQGAAKFTTILKSDFPGF